MLFTLGRFGDRDFAADFAAMRRRGIEAIPRRVVLVGEPSRDGFLPYGQLLGQGNPAEEPLAPGQGASAADPLVILYTSGSSNRPKAVPLEHYAVIENGFNIGERQGLRAGDRVLVSIPLFWSYGVANALPATLTHGATLVLQSRFEPGGALDLIERHRCTAIYTLPAMTNALLAHPAFKPERTRIAADRRHHRRAAGRDQAHRRGAGCQPRSATSTAAPRPTAIAASRRTIGRSTSARSARARRCRA